MRTLELELTTKQINILFKSLETLKDIDKTNYADIMELLRYVDNKVFGE